MREKLLTDWRSVRHVLPESVDFTNVVPAIAYTIRESVGSTSMS
jgi:hypothetical protein